MYINQPTDEVLRFCTGKSVLLIDTDECNHILHHVWLRKYHLKLICTKSLRHAIWLVQENPPDLILSEIDFNGYVHYAHLYMLRYEYDVPIIIQSLQPIQNHKENCMIRGAEAYFTKPIDWNNYLKVIERCLIEN